MNMMARCYNKNHNSYSSYGGSSIKVCEEWHYFDNFLKDMGERREGKTIDRIKNTAGYEKSNCRWATHTEQQRNTTRNKIIKAFGKSETLSYWSEESGLSIETIRYRINRGWPPEEALSKSPSYSNRVVAAELGDTVDVPEELLK